MLIDTHCHLTDERLADQIDEVLGRARAAGVIKIISPSTSLEDARKVVEVADKYDEVFGLVGVHPESISVERSLEHTRDDMLELEKLARSSKKVVGIGEIGLDSKTQNNMELQKIVFKEQLELAVELGLPVAIHMREAEAEMIEVLDSMKKLPAGQFHCWAGSEELLKKVIELGFYVSFCGNITFKSADNLRRLIKIVPPDRLLFETDSPYLSPEPRRGSQNEPANVTIIAEYIANLLGSPIETLINQTTANAKCLYFGG